jgi:hypothetical protein
VSAYRTVKPFIFVNRNTYIHTNHTL